MTHSDKETPENKELIRAAFEALSSGDSRPLVGLLADDVTWKVMGQTPWSRQYHGKASVLNDLLRPLGSRLATPYRAHADRIICDGSFVVVQARGETTTKDGLAYNNEYCFVYRVENGAIKEVTEYLDTQLVVTALSETRER
jgi:ketosteroid isomerase-like protein